MCARRIDVVRGGAPKFEIDVCCLLYTSQLVSNVINLDFSFRTRILSPSNSSGVLRYESETVLVLFQEPRFKSFLYIFKKLNLEVHMTAPVWVSSLSAGNPIPPNPPIKVECEKTEHVPPLLPRTFPQHCSGVGGVHMRTVPKPNHAADCKTGKRAP